jgi:hypothetical protein
VKEHGVSWGQAQKGINVILKCHQFLFHQSKKKLNHALDCPLDSVVLKKIGQKKSLRKISKSDYKIFQDEILVAARNERVSSRVKFDKHWDEQNLRRAGLL